MKRFGSAPFRYDLFLRRVVVRLMNVKHKYLFPVRIKREKSIPKHIVNRFRRALRATTTAEYTRTHMYIDHSWDLRSIFIFFFRVEANL